MNLNVKRIVLGQSSQYEPGPYSSVQEHPFHYVPSSIYFYLRVLLQHPDQVHHAGPFQMAYTRPDNISNFDILTAMIPDVWLPHFSMRNVDPRLWATLVQLYTGLPHVFSSYPIPLEDIHLPLLQRISNTRQFSLVTILELPFCPDLTDTNIQSLRALHTLTALDASATSLTTAGIQRLVETLLWTQPEGDEASSRIGPWSLRILRLQGCRKIDSGVMQHLVKLPLLSVVGVLLLFQDSLFDLIPSQISEAPDAVVELPPTPSLQPRILHCIIQRDSQTPLLVSKNFARPERFRYSPRPKYFVCTSKLSSTG